MIRRSWGKTMKIKFGRILAALFGLTLLSMGGGVFAAPAGVPQQMVPSYMPASPSRGVASFRPHYRPQPVRSMARLIHPANVPPHYYAPVRHAAGWPIPVSYRPIAPLPHPRFPPPYGYRGQARHGAGYPLPVRGYGVRPMPRMADGYPARPPVGAWGYPRSPQFRLPRPYPPMAPVHYRPPNWSMPRPYRAYPNRQSYPLPVVPGPQAMPRRFAGRYQPYSRPPGGQPDYRFRPIPQPVVYQGFPVARTYPALPGFPANYRFRPGPRNPGLTRMPSAGSYQARQMPDRPIRRGEVLAWENTAKQFSRTVY